MARLILNSLLTTRWGMSTLSILCSLTFFTILRRIYVLKIETWVLCDQVSPSTIQKFWLSLQNFWSCTPKRKVKKKKKNSHFSAHEIIYVKFSLINGLKITKLIETQRCFSKNDILTALHCLVMLSLMNP